MGFFGQLTANLRLNVSQFKQSLDDVAKRTRVVGKILQNSFNGASINAAGVAVNGFNSGLKDTQRIISGILISQIFYNATGAIKDAAKAVYDFAGNMQMAAIGMEYFLGSKEEAQAFLQVMKDFAAITPFSTEQALTLSRRLMAMGFAAQQTRGVMQILTDAAAATGGTAEQMDRIVLALGQMKTNGYIAGQELRQLAESGIPIYKILAEELGLTADQLRQIGRLKISGDLGVQAVLSGLERRYKGAAARIADTLPGIASTIKDDLLILSNALFTPQLNALTGFLTKIRDTLEKWRSTLFSKGIGGIFESIFPPDIQEKIRHVAGGLRTIGQSIHGLLNAMKPVVALIAERLLNALNLVIAPVASIVRCVSALIAAAFQAFPALTYLASAILALLISNVVTKGLFLLWRVTGLGVICNTVALAVKNLALAIKSLGIIMYRNPLTALIMLAAGAFLYWALSTKTVTGWLDKLGAKLNGLAGIDTSKILQPVDDKTVGNMDKYNKSLDLTKSNLKGVGKNAEAAGKATKNNFAASFDELYQIPDQLGDISSAISNPLDGMDPLAEVPDVGGLGDVGSDIKLPDLGNAFDGAKKVISGFIDDTKRFFTNDLGPIMRQFFTTTIPKWWNKGAAFISDWYNNKAPEWVRNTGEWLNNVGVAVYDGLTYVGGIFSDWWDKTKPFWSGVWEDIKDIASTAWTAMKPAAKVIFNGLSSVVVDIFGGLKSFWERWGDDITGVFRNSMQLAGEVATAAWDGAIELIKIAFGGIKAFWDKWGNDILGTFRGFWELAKRVFSIASNLIMTSVTTVFNLIKAFWDSWGSAIIKSFQIIWNGVKTIVSDALSIIGDIVGIAFNTINGIIKFALDILRGDWSKAWDDVKLTLSDTWKGIVSILSSAWDIIKTVFKTALDLVVLSLSTTWGKISDEVSSTWEAITGTIGAWLTSIAEGIGTFITNQLKALSDLWTDIKNDVDTLWKIVVDAIAGWIGGIAQDFTNFATDTVKVFSNIWKDIKTDVGTWWKTLTNTIKGWTDGIEKGFTTFKTNAVSKVKGIWTDIKKDIGTEWNLITNKLKGITDGITTAFGNFKIAASTVFDDLWKGIKSSLNSMIGGINNVIDSLNGLHINIPSIEVPFVGTVGGGSFSLPHIPRIPRLETGGIVNKNAIVELAEKNRPEAVIPLKNQAFMQPFADAVADGILSALGGTGALAAANAQPPLYVGTLIADDRSLKELYRKMQIIGLSEGQRKGLQV